MPRPSFHRLEELFNRAVELPAADRAAFLDRHCDGDPELRAALEDMLRHDRDDPTEDGALVSPIAEAAGELRADTPTLPAGGAASRAAAAARATMPQVPGYELLAELGRGGMGVVFKARQTNLKRLVALKMLLPFAAPTPEQLARFRTEAEALARLSHPNIVPIYDVGECAAGPYFSMEYVPGPSLAAYLDGRPCDPGVAARFVETLASAMAAVHHRGIVHRDLKPANVLLAPRRDASGDGLTRPDARPALSAYDPKITDFGLAKDQADGRALTLTGTTLGTPCYMAPEQANSRSKTAVGPAADLYSLGAILYEMLTGRPPFEGATPAETIAQLVDDDPPPLSRLRPGLPRDLITVCMKCLEKAPRRRYASAGELARDLQHFQAGEPIRARAIGPVGRAIRWCRRRPLVAGLMALCAVLAVAFVITVVVYDFKLQEALNTSENKSEEERQEIVQLNVTIGINEMEGGDTYAAVLRFAEALRRDEGLPDRERTHRTRIAAALAQSPQLVSLVIAGKDLLCATLFDSGGWVATVGSDGAIEIRDIRTGEVVGPTLPQDRPVTTATFGPDGHWLVTTDAAGTTRAWNLQTGTARILLEQGGPKVRALAFQGGNRLAIVRGNRSELKVWDLSGSTPVTVSAPTIPTGSVSAFAEDGRWLATFAEDGTGQVWDVATGKTAGPPLKATKGVVQCAVSPDGQRVAVVEPDNTVRLGEAATGEWLTRSLRCGFPVRTVLFSPKGHRIFTAGAEHPALVWQVATGEVLAALAVTDATISFARFSPNGELLLTGDAFRGARVWNAATGQPLTPPLRHGGPLVAAAFRAGGKQLVTAGKTGIVTVWDLPADLDSDTPEPGEPPAESNPALRPARLANGQVGEEVAGPDGRQLAVRDVDGGVQVFDAGTGKADSPLLPHGVPVQRIGFNADRTHLITVDADRTARVWDVRSGEPLAPPLHLTHAVLRVDGGREAVVCAGGKEFAWSLQPTNRSRKWLAALARVLACGKIDETQKRQVFDADELRRAWQEYQNTPQETK